MTRWRAERYGKYFIIDFYMNIECTRESGFSIDDSMYELGNYFETEAEALEVAEKFRAILKEHHEAKEGGTNDV